MGRWEMKKVGLILASIGLAILGARTFFASWDYGSLLLWTVCQNAVLALSYNLSVGFGRRVNLGHGAFFGIGAYGSAICLSKGIPCWGGIPIGGAMAWVLAKFLSFPLARLRGAEFAVSSLCVPLLLGSLARNLEGLTGGVAGISTYPLGPEVPYALSLSLLLVSLRVHNTLLNSRWGRALRAAGEDPPAAGHVGIDSYRLERQAFVLGSTIAGLAGALYPLKTAYLGPESAFGLDLILAPVLAVLLGGQGTKWGPVLGACLMVLVQELFLVHFPRSNLLLFGVFLMISGLRRAK
jgi:branched-chain amino acid transport system permease protein